MIRARIGERFSGKLTMQKSRFPAQRSSVTVAVRTQFGRNTNQKGFEHPAALPAPQVELRNHLLHGPARVVHQGRNHRGMESSTPEKMHQQIAGVDELGVLGLGQDSLSGYFRLLGHYPHDAFEYFRFAHIAYFYYVCTLSYQKKWCQNTTKARNALVSVFWHLIVSGS